MNNSTPPEQNTLWSTTGQTKSLHEQPLSAWPAELHPTQRLHENGAAALSDAELLALILGNHGAKNPVLLASELIAAFGGWHGLHKVTVAELARYTGMNRQRAAQIKAALEIARRSLLTANGDRLQIRSPADAARLLMSSCGREGTSGCSRRVPAACGNRVPVQPLGSIRIVVG